MDAWQTALSQLSQTGEAKQTRRGRPRKGQELSASVVASIKEAQGGPTAIARMFGVAPSTVYRIKKGLR